MEKLTCKEHENTLTLIMLQHSISTSVINTALEIVDSVESLIKVLKTEECYLAWSLWENWSFQQGQWKLKNKEIEYSLHFF